MIPHVMVEFWRACNMCDMTLLVGGQVFHTHRLVLSAASDKMANKFENFQKESHELDGPAARRRARLAQCKCPGLFGEGGARKRASGLPPRQI